MITAIESWFSSRQRDLPWRGRYDPWEIWVSEVMLQQTRMEVVLRYFPRFITAFPTVKSLAAAKEDEVVALWSGLGYYRRARMLHRGAQYVAAEHDGVVPSDVERLLKIPGVGRYTAGAIASIAFDRPAPVVDGNVIRLFSRIFLLDSPVGSAELNRELWRRAAEVVEAAESPRNLNQGLMELGSLVCRTGQPDCDRCPVSDFCLGFQHGVAEQLPVRLRAAEPVLLTIPLYVIRNEEGHVLMRIEKQGSLMRSMYHLPMGSNALFEYERPLAVVSPAMAGSFGHTITNRRIRFEVVVCEGLGGLADGGGGYEWVAPERLRELPHSSYVQKAMKVAGVK